MRSLVLFFYNSSSERIISGLKNPSGFLNRKDFKSAPILNSPLLIKTAIAIILTLMGGMKTVIRTDFILFLVIVTAARITIVSIGNDLPDFNQ